MTKGHLSHMAPDPAWQTPAATWEAAIDRYTSFLQIPAWRVSVNRDGSERVGCLTSEGAARLSERLRKVLARLEVVLGESVSGRAPHRADLDALWRMQGRHVPRSERCPTELQGHFQRALLLNESGYTCAYCRRTAWGVFEERSESGPRTLRFEIEHRETRRRLPDRSLFDSNNLAAACRSCNAIKAELLEETFLVELRSLARAVNRSTGL